jgi:Zn-dependent protease
VYRSSFANFGNWSVRIGRIAGFPIYLHFTLLFFLLPIFMARANGIAFVYDLEIALGVVLSILLHELGHAFAARRFRMSGISITLHGFGGFASSSGMRTPVQALIISLAGPAVTFALGLLCFGLGKLGLSSTEFGTAANLQFQIVAILGSLNILLGFLNLVPSLPFDGGNALVALLSRKRTEYSAMRTVGHIGLVLMPLFVLYGWFTNAGYFALFGLMGFITSLMTLQNSGGIRFGEGAAQRKERQEEMKTAKATERRETAYYDDVKRREKEREERERLRKLFESSVKDDNDH